ncbi:MAG: hypothetical protein PHU44_19195 [Syntrophales bacterium]|nr:hypothetical protein [Syntrophales bacterium]MDD5643041.1 hypothetical protein [Syntrophales bacterium]
MRKREFCLIIAKLKQVDIFEPIAKVSYWRMKRDFDVTIILIAVLLLIILGKGMAQAASFTGFTGNDYLKMDKHSQIGYLSGVRDAFLINQIIMEEKNVNDVNIDQFVKCTTGMTAFQIQALINKYLKNHPEDWHMLMPFLIVKAVLMNCKSK